MITTIDVAAAFDTNKYLDSKLEKRDNWWFAESKEIDGDGSINRLAIIGSDG
ncbi:MAG: hypothetical protein PHH69_03460 [Candidatus Omnitrophica bacterium]|nr:hypothetical protein [Candidatus Omnitrophota bacterium]